MANWRGSGSAIRRRMGAPSAHNISTGIGGRVNLPTPEEALAGMARVGAPRVPMGTSAITDFANAPAVPPLKGDLIPKTGNAKGDVPHEPPTAIKANVPVFSEKSGAAYRIRAVQPPMIDPAAGATQANGKIVPSILGRGGSFGDGATGSYVGY
jgi:hypothetical protein